MDIILVLLGIPIGIFANVSTDFLVNKFKHIKPKKIFKIFQDSIIEGIENYPHMDSFELKIKSKLLDAIKLDTSKLFDAIENTEYNEITISELRTERFKLTLMNNIAHAYNVSEVFNSKIGEKIINSCLCKYEQNFFTSITKSDVEKFILTKLSKIHNDVAKQGDINELRQFIVENFNSDKVFNDQVLSDWIYNEISNVESDSISDSIKYRMKQLDKIVEYLTEDQKRILDHQKYHNQLLIKGCAGSGKTIVAAEKAIRLSKAGFKVLITCHNPFLANHIKALVVNSGVEVIPFYSLIEKYSMSIQNVKLEQDWSIHIEPTIEEIEYAFDNILESSNYYDAIIVDEGQDFKDDWWSIIDALLENSHSKILYIFSDDNQSFASIKTKYPLKESRINLSKNVRNAGKIYDLIKQFHPNAPPTTAILENYGITKVENLEKDLLVQQVLDSINESSEFINLKELAILTISDQLENSLKLSFENESYLLSNAIDNKVNKLLEKVSWHFLKKPIDFVFKMPIDDIQKNRISQLIRNIERHMPKGIKGYKGNFFWKRNYIKLNEKITRIDHDLFERKGDEYVICENPIGIFSYFNTVNWAELLPSIQSISINNGKIVINQSEHDIPIEPITNYKGLEAKGIILIIDRPTNHLETFLYVGISRAVFYLKILIDKKTIELIQRTGRKLK